MGDFKHMGLFAAIMDAIFGTRMEKFKRMNHYSAGTIEGSYNHRRSQSKRRKMQRRTGIYNER